MKKHNLNKMDEKISVESSPLTRPRTERTLLDGSMCGWYNHLKYILKINLTLLIKINNLSLYHNIFNNNIVINYYLNYLIFHFYFFLEFLL